MASGSIVKQTYDIVAVLLDQVTMQSYNWRTRNTWGSRRGSYHISCEPKKGKKVEKRDDNMAKVMT